MAAKRILIVDDDPKLLDIVSHFLKQAGYDVYGTPDSEKAADLAASVQADLAILDITMPRKDGFELAAQLVEKTPCMFLTARKGAADRERAKEVGVSGYLEKPFKKAELLSMVKELLSQRVNK